MFLVGLPSAKPSAKTFRENLPQKAFSFEDYLPQNLPQNPSARIFRDPVSIFWIDSHLNSSITDPLSIAQVLEMVADRNQGCLKTTKPPETLVLPILPFTLLSETQAEWVNILIAQWDDAIDLKKLFRGSQIMPEGKCRKGTD